jgi:hypothetical protein
MSTTPPANTSVTIPAEYPEPTEEDREAMFASVVWFVDQQSSGALDKYEGMHVAILGEHILEADSDKNELIRRLESLGNTIPPNRIVIKYVYRMEDLI